MAVICFPLAGLGSRFQAAGYHQTKPLINVAGRTFVELAVDSVRFKEEDTLLFIIRRDQSLEHGLDVYLRSRFPGCIVHELDKLTQGSLSTVYECLSQIELPEQPLVVHTSDIIMPNPIRLYDVDYSSMAASSVIFKANNASYSYSLLDENGTAIRKMVEKRRISNYANVGIYLFASLRLFVDLSRKVLAREAGSLGEYYVSEIFNEYIKNDHLVESIMAQEVYVIGTPAELDFYLKFVNTTSNPSRIGFVSDHSGFAFKSSLISHFKDSKYHVLDYGCFSCRPCDYSDYVPVATDGLKDGHIDILIGSCESGQGINITANKTQGCISSLVFDAPGLYQSRRHNCPNMLVFPSSVWDPSDAFNAIVHSLEQIHFEGGRHSDRLRKALGAR